ncbi:MAG: DUF6537 domain-containing protein, partial [Acidimicrobiales bacterium]
NETFPGVDRFRTRIESATVGSANVWLDAEAIARHVFASQPAANLLVVGVAHQLGRIPLRADSIERAIELNGVAVEANRNAFRLGRRLATDPALADELARAAVIEEESYSVVSPEASALIAQVAEPTPALSDALSVRVPELIAWGDAAYAQSYIDDVAAVRRAEIGAGAGDGGFSTAVARHLFKFMAYKDEYEVARLALAGEMEAKARERFGINAKVSYQLKPPTLKNAGYDKKIAIPAKAARVTFRSLLRTKRLRGTRLDPFGRTEERRLERELIDDYRTLVLDLASRLTAENVAAITVVADLADQIRGFDEIKLASVERYRIALADALIALDQRGSIDVAGGGYGEPTSRTSPNEEHT